MQATLPIKQRRSGTQCETQLAVVESCRQVQSLAVILTFGTDDAEDRHCCAIPAFCVSNLSSIRLAHSAARPGNQLSRTSDHGHRRLNSPVSVSISILSPISTKAETCNSCFVSFRIAALVILPDVSPRATGSVYSTSRIMVFGNTTEIDRPS